MAIIFDGIETGKDVKAVTIDKLTKKNIYY